MNKHGQTLILFVILIPIILILMALVVDTGLVLAKKIQVKEITKEVIEECLNSNDEKIKEQFKKIMSISKI